MSAFFERRSNLVRDAFLLNVRGRQHEGRFSSRDRLDVIRRELLVTVGFRDFLHPAEIIEPVETFDRVSFTEQFHRLFVAAALLTLNLADFRRDDSRFFFEQP